MSGVLAVTGIPLEGIPAYALVTGDPDRVPRIAERLADARSVARRREYVTVAGSWKGVDVVVASHGIGAPGAALLFHEMAQAGVTTIVRAGTCGALVESIQDGDLIIATRAVREDGVTDQMVPPDYPSSSTSEVVMALQGAAERLGHPCHVGAVVTSALFFPGLLEETLPKHARDGVIGVEMELSALLVVAGLRGMRAGGVLAVDGHPVGRSDPRAYKPSRAVVLDAVDAAITVGLDALADLAQAA